MNDEEVKRLAELVIAAKKAEASLHNLSGVMGEVSDFTGTLRVKALTHQNWPELCDCAECREMAKTIADIRQNVLG